MLHACEFHSCYRAPLLMQGGSGTRVLVHAVLVLLFLHSVLAERRNPDLFHHSDPNANSGVKDPTTHTPLSNKDYEREESAANNITVASLTLYVWEYIATLPREIMMYRRHMLVRPQVMLFLLIRYGTLPAIIVTTYSYFGRFKECIQHQAITIAVVQCLLSCISAWRTSAIWRHNRVIVIILAILVTSVTISSIVLMYYLDIVRLTSKDGICRPGRDQHDDNPNTAPWFYLVSMIFDTITMVLTSYKLITYARLGRDLEQPVFRDPFSGRKELIAAGDEKGPKRTFWRRVSMHAINIHNTIAASVSFYKNLHNWTLSFTPLLGRLFYNGLIYFAVATMFNLVTMILELIRSLHSKTLLPLYAPLMCVLCQRMLLVEFDFVWAANLPHLEVPGIALVDHVTGNRKSVQQSETDRLAELIDSLEERRQSTRMPRPSAAMMEEGNVVAHDDTPTVECKSAPEIDPYDGERGSSPGSGEHGMGGAPVLMFNTSDTSAGASSQSRRQSAVSFDMPSPRTQRPPISEILPPASGLPILSPKERQQALRMAGM